MPANGDAFLYTQIYNFSFYMRKDDFLVRDTTRNLEWRIDTLFFLPVFQCSETLPAS
jgi:hypothetical protein